MSTPASSSRGEQIGQDVTAVEDWNWHSVQDREVRVEHRHPEQQIGQYAQRHDGRPCRRHTAGGCPTSNVRIRGPLPAQKLVLLVVDVVILEVVVNDVRPDVPRTRMENRCGGRLVSPPSVLG